MEGAQGTFGYGAVPAGISETRTTSEPGNEFIVEAAGSIEAYFNALRFTPQ